MALGTKNVCACLLDLSPLLHLDPLIPFLFRIHNLWVPPLNKEPLIVPNLELMWDYFFMFSFSTPSEYTEKSQGLAIS